MGGKSKSVTVGYRYFMGVHMLICQGTADSINKIVVGEKLAYNTPVTSSFDEPVITSDAFIKDPVSIPIAYASINWDTLSLTINAIRPKNFRTNVGFPEFTTVTRIFTGSQTTVSKLVVGVDSTTFTLGAPTHYPTGAGFIDYLEVDMVAERSGVTTTFRATVARRGLNTSPPSNFTTVPIAANANDTFDLNAVAVNGLKISSQPLQTLYVDKPNLFGGEKREGGVRGFVDVLFGVKGQGKNPYLKIHQGADTPANLGFTSLVFKSFYWAAMNPYFKPVWIEATRILKGWSIGPAWYPETASILTGGGTTSALVYDMNPIHIIYQCLTDSRWGLGYSVDDIDDVSFRSAALNLHIKNVGLSLMWDNQSSLEDFIKTILDHINGNILILRGTGKFSLRLVGYPYPHAATDIPPIQDFNSKVKSYQRSVLGELPNEVVVTYRDRLENSRSLTVQNIASISAQGSVVSVTKEFIGIKNPGLAISVAKRELRMVSEPLAKLEVVVDYSFSALTIGDVVRVRLPSLNLIDEAFTVIDMAMGGEEDAITLTLLEDLGQGGTISGFAGNAGHLYDPYNGLTSGIDTAVPVQDFKIFEAPYWFVFFQHSRAELAYLMPEYGFGMCVASKSLTDTVSLTYDMYASPTLNGSFTSLSTGDFCPSGTLTTAIDQMATSLTIQSFYDLQDVETESEGGYVIIGNEILALTNINVLTGAFVVRRGCLDTPPLKHAAGTRVFFERGVSASDSTERVAGETTYYKLATNTTDTSFNLSSITAFGLNFQNRAGRPYPPAKLRINGLAYPSSVAGGFTITWASRNRLTQTVEFVDNTVDSITPEIGTTYNVRIYRKLDNLLLQEHLNIAETTKAISGLSANFIVVSVETVTTVSTPVAGGTPIVTTLSSLYRHEHEFTYTP